MTGAEAISGDYRSLARAATLIENGHAPFLAELLPHTGKARIVGITGAPGAGKSTLTAQMIRLLRSQGKKIAVLAVDPSSPVTGGAILGDRIRMQDHHDDPGVFVRSMATRGALGGLAIAAANLVTLMDAAGFDFVLVETVGVGQAEVDVAKLAGITVVVLAPGNGDDVQALKAGLMEIADLFVLNKADREGVGALEQSMRQSGIEAPIFRTSAMDGTGIAELLTAIEALPARQKTPPTGAKIDHLGIAVASIDAALGFWKERLGLAVASRETVAIEKVDVAMLPVGESRVELLQATEPDSTIAKFIDKRGEGLHHVALRVPDLTGTVVRLKAAGARVLNEPRAGAGGNIYVFVHPASTGGVLLELIQE